MLPIPKFDLTKEKTRTLWLGIVFFGGVAVLLIHVAMVSFAPWLAPRYWPKQEARRTEDPSTPDRGAIEEIMERHLPKDTPPEPNILRAISCLLGAAGVMAATVAPITRELMQRRRA
jgi:hypothetical protein